MLRADNRGLIPGRGKTLFFSVASLPALRSTQPPIQWVSRALSMEVKWQEREADHSSSSSADIKNGGTIFPLPIRLHDVVLNYIIKYRDNFTIFTKEKKIFSYCMIMWHICSKKELRARETAVASKCL
jgi:hypothetical protein